MASQDQDKASANLLRRAQGDSALPARKPGDACPNPDILAAYFDHSLSAEETACYELHFSECARCREQLAAIDRASEHAAAASAMLQPASHWTWLWDWRVLAPVAAVLVIAAVWLARRPAPNRVAGVNSQPPLVAMSRPSEAPGASALEPKQPYAAPPASPALNPPASSTSGAIGGVAQQGTREESQTLDKKEKFAPNLPLNSRNELRSDELGKDQGALKRDSNRARYDAAQQASNSSPAVSPLQPPAWANSALARGNAETATVTADANSLPATTAAKRARPSGAAIGAEALTQQAQTQTVVQSKALALEAAEKRPAGTVVATPDPKFLWRIAEGGFVERSTDGGATWQGQLPEENAELTAGSAPSPRVCWLVGRDGAILLTKDASRWKRISPPAKADFVSVSAQDASSATVTAADGRKFTTSDRGKHWIPAP